MSDRVIVLGLDEVLVVDLGPDVAEDLGERGRARTVERTPQLAGRVHYVSAHHLAVVKVRPDDGPSSAHPAPTT